MTDVKTLAASTWRDYVVDGVSSSGVNDPSKADIRDLFGSVESLKTSAVADLAGLKGLATRPLSVLVKTGLAAGSWEWEASATDTTDDELIVQPTSGDAGRYKRIQSSLVTTQTRTGTKTATGAIEANQIILFDDVATASDGVYTVAGLMIVHHIGNDGTGGSFSNSNVKGPRSSLYVAAWLESPSDPANVAPNYTPIQTWTRALTHDNGRAGTLAASASANATTLHPDSTTYTKITSIGKYVAVTLDNGKQFVTKVTAKSSPNISIDPPLPSAAASGNALWYADGVRGTIYPIGTQSSVEAGATNLVGNTAEFDFCVLSGGSAWINGGVNAVLGGSGFPHVVPGKAADFGFGVSSTTGNSAWLRHGLLLHPFNGAFPLDPTVGTVLGSIDGVFSCGIDFRHNTINNYVIITDHFSVDALGVIAAKSASFATGGAAAVLIGTNSDYSTFNLVSLNGLATDAGYQGIMGAANAHLYLQAAAGGSIVFKDGGGINATLDSGGDLDVLASYLVNSTKVVGPRDTGWAAMTGSPDKATSYATGSVTLPQLAGRVAQLQAALTTHGLIGT